FLFLQREFDLRDVVRFVHGSLRISEGARRQGPVARVAAGTIAVTPEILARTFRRPAPSTVPERRARFGDEEPAVHRLLQVRARPVSRGNGSLHLAPPASA